MAFQEISTGYKPEFTLGGLYHGFNAANAEDMSQEEILKQYLLNQREQQMQPLDIEKARLTNQGIGFDMPGKQLVAEQAELQRTPAMLQGFIDSKQAGYDETNRKNEIGFAMHPEALRQAPIKAEVDRLSTQRMQDVARLDDVISKGFVLDPNTGDRVDIPQGTLNTLKKQREDLVAQQGSTADLFGKMRVESLKGQLDIDKTIAGANIAADASRYSAERRASAGTDQYIKLLQSDINTLEKESSDLTERVAEARRIAGMIKRPENTQALADLETKKAQVESVLKQSRAELRNRVTGGGSNATTQAQPTEGKMTVEKLQSMYPGIPVDKLKAAYKQKFGEDL